MTLVRITILCTAGSAPRDAGTVMHVGPATLDGTIGGGALEYRAIRTARDMLRAGRPAHEETIPLGPDLGQCCGGSVRLRYEVVKTATDPDSGPTRPLWIWGAGHVGRALAHTLAPLPDLALTWIDTGPDRFPDHIPDGVTPLPAADMTRLVPHAPARAEHLIVTYSHEIDLALCHALLTHGFAAAGLIGSATKWARFRKRLQSLGHSDAQISRIACPIGDPTLGKHPQAIAVGVAAALLSPAERPGLTGTGAR